MGFHIGRFLKKNLGTIAQVAGSANPVLGMIISAASGKGSITKASSAVLDGITGLMGGGDWDAADFKEKYAKEAEFRSDIMKLEVEKEKEWQKLHIQDLESARNAEQGRMEKGSWITANINTVLALFLCCLFGFGFIHSTLHPQANPSTIQVQMFEMLKISMASMLTYYFGSSIGSKKKTEAMQDQIREKL